MGKPLFPWQRYVADVALEVDPESGRWAYSEVVITAPRRSGKTHLVGPVTVHRLSESVPRLSRITAQTLDKAVERWAEVCVNILQTPIRHQVRQYTGNPRSLRWVSGSRFAPFTPSEQGMHGEDTDLVWVDELQAFDMRQARMIRQGYRPVFSVKPGQAWLMSTAGTQSSEWLNQVRRQGRERVESGEVGRRRAYFEWSAPESVGDMPLSELADDDLVRVVVDAHPRRDHGLIADELLMDLEDMTRPEWLRAYGNITQVDEDHQGAFTAAQMDRAKSGARIADDARVALGVSVDPDRRESSIGIAVRDGLGVAITDEKRADGTRWVAGQVIGLVDKYDVGTVAVVGAGAARSVADELERAGVPLLRLSQADHAAACAGFADEFGAERPSVTWNGSVEFARAVTAAEGRRKASGLVWESRTGAAITALDARTLAVWAHDHAPKPEPRIAPRIW